jgi:hypothetical protein
MSISPGAEDLFAPLSLSMALSRPVSMKRGRGRTASCMTCHARSVGTGAIQTGRPTIARAFSDPCHFPSALESQTHLEMTFLSLTNTPHRHAVHIIDHGVHAPRRPPIHHPHSCGNIIQDLLLHSPIQCTLKREYGPFCIHPQTFAPHHV